MMLTPLNATHPTAMPIVSHGLPACGAAFSVFARATSG
jgi:hypothetical protein